MGQEATKALPWTSDELLPGDEVTLKGKELAAHPELKGPQTVNSVDGKKVRLDGIGGQTFSTSDIKLVHNPQTKMRRQIFKLLLSYVNSCKDFSRPPIQKVVNTLSSSLRVAALPACLDMSAEGVTDEDCYPLFVFVFPTLWFASIDLSYNKIGPYGGAALGRALLNCKKSPESIILRGNPLSPDGVFDIAELLLDSQLQVLDVADTQIGKLGVTEILNRLKESGEHSRLRTLRLERNSAQDKEVKLLAEVLDVCKNLQQVSIYPPHGSYEGFNRLFRWALSDTELEILKRRSQEVGQRTSVGGSSKITPPERAAVYDKEPCDLVPSAVGEVDFVTSLMLTADSVSLKNSTLVEEVNRYRADILEAVMERLIRSGLQENARVLSFLNVIIHRQWKAKYQAGHAPVRIVSEWFNERRTWSAYDKAMEILSERHQRSVRSTGKLKGHMPSSIEVRGPDGGLIEEGVPHWAVSRGKSVIKMGMKIDMLEHTYRTLMDNHQEGTDGKLEKNLRNLQKSVQKLASDPEFTDEALRARVTDLQAQVEETISADQARRFEGALDELVAMFPAIPRPVLLITLADCHGVMEVAIDALLNVSSEPASGETGGLRTVQLPAGYTRHFPERFDPEEYQMTPEATSDFVSQMETMYPGYQEYFWGHGPPNPDWIRGPLISTVGGEAPEEGSGSDGNGEGGYEHYDEADYGPDAAGPARQAVTGAGESEAALIQHMIEGGTLVLEDDVADLEEHTVFDRPGGSRAGPSGVGPGEPQGYMVEYEPREFADPEYMQAYHREESDSE